MYSLIMSSYKAAGFTVDANTISIKNDLGVHINDFLQARGAEMKEVIKRGNTWIFAKFDNTHFVCFRKQTEKKTTFATVQSINRW